ncbi:hypothetical protein PRIPAC_82068 [Pristionchus pacificus]|uniref:Uncharacterized protein n=1 Tax=Pristionchus pacificus TaxID=54126 RepID=A0A2A6CQA8_PRIPA|nr:hypothetical protein PRIPAC_82068 [Pristionchus pacificus]|eukprot:PDM80268.1 hypothetical protein PRIPAC_32847 [Pristionchus pacificus]
MDELSSIDSLFQQLSISDDVNRFSSDTVDNLLQKLTLSDDVRDPSSLSPIELFPRELSWKIIQFVPEAVFNLRLVKVKISQYSRHKKSVTISNSENFGNWYIQTSRLLYSRVAELALERDTIRLVDSLDINQSKIAVANEDKQNPLETFKLVVPKSKSSLFELRLKHHLLERNLKRAPLDGTLFEYRLEINPLNASDVEKAKKLRDCVGKRAGTLIVHWYWRSGTSSLPFVYDHLSGIQFDALKVEEFCMSAVLLNSLPSIVADHNVDHISLHVAEVTSHDTVEVLLHLSSLVSSIHLKQLNAYRSHASNYMLGVSSADWGQIIIDMFSRKVKKLLIDNEFFPAYLPKDAADRLIARCQNRILLVNLNAFRHSAMDLQDLSEDFRKHGNGTKDERTLSPMEMLPREIVWMIVGYALESVFDLSMTSRLLRARVTEFTIQQNSLRLVTSLELDRSADLTKEKVILRVRNRYNSIFELRLQHRQLHSRVKRVLGKGVSRISSGAGLLTRKRY